MQDHLFQEPGYFFGYVLVQIYQCLDICFGYFGEFLSIKKHLPTPVGEVVQTDWTSLPTGINLCHSPPSLHEVCGVE